MKRILLAVPLLAVSAFAQSACLPTAGVIDNVAYVATSSNGGGLFPWYTTLHLQTTDPRVSGFRVTVELKNGQLAPAQLGQANPQPFVVANTPTAPSAAFVANWCDVARVTIENLATESVHQIR